MDSDSLSAADLAALIGAIAALTTALGALIYQIRMMRREIVQAVEAHMLATITSRVDQETVTPHDATE